MIQCFNWSVSEFNKNFLVFQISSWKWNSNNIFLLMDVWPKKWFGEERRRIVFWRVVFIMIFIFGRKRQNSFFWARNFIQIDWTRPHMFCFKRKNFKCTQKKWNTRKKDIWQKLISRWWFQKNATIECCNFFFQKLFFSLQHFKFKVLFRKFICFLSMNTVLHGWKMCFCHIIFTSDNNFTNLANMNKSSEN